MPEFFHDFQLSTDSDYVTVFEDKIFLKNFYCDLLVGKFMEGQFNFTEISFSKSLEKGIAF
jgi:hypothetical protein